MKTPRQPGTRRGVEGRSSSDNSNLVNYPLISVMTRVVKKNLARYSGTSRVAGGQLAECEQTELHDAFNQRPVYEKELVHSDVTSLLSAFKRATCRTK